MSRRKVKLERSGPWIGVGGLFIVLWLAISSVLYAPWWGIALNLLLIVPQAFLVSRWARTKPTWCVGVPLVGAALHSALAFVGATWWGWSAG